MIEVSRPLIQLGVNIQHSPVVMMMAVSAISSTALLTSLAN